MTYMVFHMKTTLNIADPIMIRLKQEAARQGKTMSDLVESALRLFLARSSSEPVEQSLPDLPSFASGSHLTDIDDRNALYRAMDEG